MLIGWIFLAVVISLALSLCAVLWDAIAGAAYQNERARQFVRKALLLDSTENLAGEITTLAERLADLPSGFRVYWRENYPRFARALDLVAVALLLAYEAHHYAADHTIRPVDMLAWAAIAVGIVAYLVALGSDTRKI